MAKFVFKLDPLKQMRENRLKAARRELADLQAKAVRLGADLRRCVDSGRDAMENGAAAANGADCLRNGEIVRLAHARAEHLRKDIQFVEGEIERQRRWVAHLGQELRAVEKLEENKRSAFNAQQSLLEKRRMDRWTAENHSRERFGRLDEETDK